MIKSGILKVDMAQWAKAMLCKPDSLVLIPHNLQGKEMANSLGSGGAHL